MLKFAFIASVFFTKKRLILPNFIPSAEKFFSVLGNPKLIYNPGKCFFPESEAKTKGLFF